MFDTIILTLDLDDDMRETYSTAIQECARSEFRPGCLNVFHLDGVKHPHYIRFVTEVFADRGFYEVAFLDYSRREYPYYILEIKYRPAKYLYPSDAMQVCESEDVIPAIDNFNKFVRQINGYVRKGRGIPEWDNIFWEIAAIGYAFQFKTSAHKEYMRLLKAYLPEDETPENDNNLLVKEKYLLWQFSDVTAKSSTTGDEPTAHILRLEVVYWGKALEKIKEEYMYNHQMLEEFWWMTFAYKIVKPLWGRCFGTRDFYTFDGAVERIEKRYGEKLPKEELEYMKEFLGLVIRYCGIEEAEAEFLRGHPKLPLSYVIRFIYKRFAKIDLNPRTIPAGEEGVITRLKNPWRIIKKQCGRTARLNRQEDPGRKRNPEYQEPEYLKVGKETVQIISL